jgi:hypothetical protein
VLDHSYGPLWIRKIEIPASAFANGECHEILQFRRPRQRLRDGILEDQYRTVTPSITVRTGHGLDSVGRHGSLGLCQSARGCHHSVRMPAFGSDMG